MFKNANYVVHENFGMLFSPLLTVNVQYPLHAKCDFSVHLLHSMLKLLLCICCFQTERHFIKKFVTFLIFLFLLFRCPKIMAKCQKVKTHLFLLRPSCSCL